MLFPIKEENSDEDLIEQASLDDESSTPASETEEQKDSEARENDLQQE